VLRPRRPYSHRPLNPARIHWPHDPGPAVASNEQEHDSSDQPNVVPRHIHLVLNLDEFATIVMALRAIELHGFADRLDTMLRQVGQPPES
jgi:extradiol dioxygenase family protein